MDASETRWLVVDSNKPIQVKLWPPELPGPCPPPTRSWRSGTRLLVFRSDAEVWVSRVDAATRLATLSPESILWHFRRAERLSPPPA